MSTTRVSAGAPATTRYAAGAAGGVAGGIAFGLVMQAMGMMPMVAMLVGSEVVPVGWLVHLAISVFAGVVFAVALGRFATSVARSTAAGAAYGVLWWVVGALVLMPARLGMDLLVLNTTAWQSLMGHLVFGVLLGAAYALLVLRRRG